MIVTSLGLKKPQDTDNADLLVFIGENIDTIESLLNNKININEKISLPASTTTIAPLNIPHGTSPSTPINGDIWTTTSGILARINGATITLANTSQWSTITQAEAEGGTSTTARLITGQRLAQSINALSPVKTVNGTSGNVVITPESIGAALISHTHTATDLPDGTTAAKGIVQLSSATNSTSNTLAATASAVKAAYDLANGKANSSHTHAAVDITQTASYRFVTDTEKTAWNNKANALHTHLWADITDKPTTFSPSTHTHNWSDIISGKPTTLSGYGITDAETPSGAQTKANTAENNAKNYSDSLNKINILDTRSVNGLPSAYSDSSNGRKVHFEFKSTSTIGINNGTYCTLITDGRWFGASGGRKNQIALTDSGKIFTRLGNAAETAWDPWVELLTANSGISSTTIGKATISSAAPSSPLANDIWIDTN